jgi:hypothetical protein
MSRSRFFTNPGLEAVAQRVHVTVGAHAGIAEQVPGAADALAALEQDERPSGALAAQVHGGTDARQAGADDEHLHMFRWHAGRLSRRILL